MTSVHAFSCKLASGELVPLSRYAGKSLLIVNTASLCGFSHSNMQGLNELQSMYDRPHVKDMKYRGRLMVLAFPCNQFAAQEPKSACEVRAWATASYGTTYPIFDKVDVKGPNADPLWKFLGQELGAPKWNFNKYLIDPAGRPVKRFNPATTPENLKGDIDSVLDGN
jgi:glutathione peroxidase